MRNIETHLKAMIELAMSDQSFDDIERAWIYNIGKVNNIEKKKVDEMIKTLASSREAQDLKFMALTFEERFEYLYDIIQLMKIDSKVFLAEIKYCEGLADKLGFEPKVVKKLSSRIYSDPGITANRDLLMNDARKYLR